MPALAPALPETRHSQPGLRRLLPLPGWLSRHV